MKTQDFILICFYSEEERNITQIIQSSFDIFIKKELQNVEKYLSAVV